MTVGIKYPINQRQMNYQLQEVILWGIHFICCCWQFKW